MLFLISSMIGPPTIWTIATREEDTEIRRTSELLGCVGHDAIICSGFSKNVLAIGTYAGVPEPFNAVCLIIPSLAIAIL